MKTRETEVKVEIMKQQSGCSRLASSSSSSSAEGFQERGRSHADPRTERRDSERSARVFTVLQRRFVTPVLRCSGTSVHWLFLAFACVRMCDLRLVDWANFLLQPSNGQT